MKILLINDDSHELMLWRTWINLQQTMQVIGETATSKEAQLLVEKHLPDAILLKFPVADLFTLDDLARFRVACPTAKLIVSSAQNIHKGNEVFVQQIFETGIDEVIYHPYKLDDLFKIISED